MGWRSASAGSVGRGWGISCVFFRAWPLCPDLVLHKDRLATRKKAVESTGKVLVGGFSVSEGIREIIRYVTDPWQAGWMRGEEGARGCRGWDVSPFGHGYADWRELFFIFRKLDLRFDAGADGNCD